jgi:hypothetical protein
MYTMKTEWLLDDVAFMAVASTALAAAAFLTSESAPSALVIDTLVAPETTVWPPAPSRYAMVIACMKAIPSRNPKQGCRGAGYEGGVGEGAADSDVSQNEMTTFFMKGAGHVS